MLAKKVVNVTRVGQFSVTYELEDGVKGAFECEPSFAAFVEGIWRKRNCAGFTIANSPKGKETVIYVVPTTDGITLKVEPKMPLRIMHIERDNSNEALVQVTLVDE